MWLGKARLWEKSSDEKGDIMRHRLVDFSLCDITGNQVLDRIVAYSTFRDFFKAFKTCFDTGVVAYTSAVHSSV